MNRTLFLATTNNSKNVRSRRGVVKTLKGASLPLFQQANKLWRGSMTSENQKRKRRARSAAAKKVKKQRCQANEAIPQMADATMARLQAQQPMLITAYDVCHNKLQAERLHRILAAKARDGRFPASSILPVPKYEAVYSRQAPASVPATVPTGPAGTRAMASPSFITCLQDPGDSPAKTSVQRSAEVSLAPPAMDSSLSSAGHVDKVALPEIAPRPTTDLDTLLNT